MPRRDSVAWCLAGIGLYQGSGGHDTCPFHGCLVAKAPERTHHNIKGCCTHFCPVAQGGHCPGPYSVMISTRPSLSNRTLDVFTSSSTSTMLDTIYDARSMAIARTSEFPRPTVNL